MLPSLVIQDQETAPRPKIAAHVTGSLPPGTDKDLKGRFSIQVHRYDYVFTFFLVGYLNFKTKDC